VAELTPTPDELRNNARGRFPTRISGFIRSILLAAMALVVVCEFSVGLRDAIQRKTDKKVKQGKEGRAWPLKRCTWLFNRIGKEKHMDLRNLKSVCLVMVAAFLVIMPMGCKKAPPITLTATAYPPAVFPGEPVTATATAGSVSTKKKVNVIYSWSGDNVTGNGATATVATASLAPGSYTVKAEVKEGKPGKEGLKPGQSADASASYTVKAYEPPTISCSASPSTIKPGEGSTVTAVGVSSQNRPLTYGYSATAGSINGSGATAAFSSAGAPTGVVGITCNVSDDKGHTATANTSVTITAPYVAPVPHTQALSSISFASDKERPTRVDNEAKAVLDEIALDLQRQPDAKLVVVGNSDATEKAKAAREQKAALRRKHLKVEDLAAERAVNVKEYLVTEKGIDASRISVATGTADAQDVQNYLVPSGANFAADVQGTTPVDESAVKPQPRMPLLVRHARKKAAAAK
jgi:outer membrane protein OmpA-like peptidoglycan-associated protein